MRRARSPDGGAFAARARVALWLVEGIRNGQPLGALLGYLVALARLHNVARAARARQVRPPCANRSRSWPQLVISRASLARPIEDHQGEQPLWMARTRSSTSSGTLDTYASFGLSATFQRSRRPGPRAAIDCRSRRTHRRQRSARRIRVGRGAMFTRRCSAITTQWPRPSTPTRKAPTGGARSRPDARGGAALTRRVFRSARSPPALDSSVSPVPGLSVGARIPAGTADGQRVARVDAAAAGRSRVHGHVDRSGCRHRPAGDCRTQRDLDLQPIDLLPCCSSSTASPRCASFDDRIVRRVVRHRTPRPDVVLTLQHTTRLPPRVQSFFEVAPLVRRLRVRCFCDAAVVRTDMALTGEAEREQDAAAVVSRTRVRDGPGCTAAATARDVGAFDPTAGTIDAAIDAAVELFERAARFGVQQVGWGFLYAWRRTAFARLLEEGNPVSRHAVERAARELRYRSRRLCGRAATLTAEEQLGPFSVRLRRAHPSTAVTPRPAVPAQDYEGHARGTSVRNSSTSARAWKGCWQRRMHGVRPASWRRCRRSSYDGGRQDAVSLRHTLPELRERVDGLVREPRLGGSADALRCGFRCVPDTRCRRVRPMSRGWRSSTTRPARRGPSDCADTGHAGGGLLVLAQRRTALDDKRARLGQLPYVYRSASRGLLAALRALLTTDYIDGTPLSLDTPKRTSNEPSRT